MDVGQVSSLFSQGITKTYQIPIEHLDYTFIETCKDVKYLEKILRILRSGEEGFYPDLILFCENHIESLNPNSRALRRDKPAATASDFTTAEWEKINNEMETWATEMKEEEYKILYDTTEVFKEKVENFPPVRSSNCCYSTDKSKTLKNRQIKKKNVPRDYREWDKFDVEQECSRMDENEKNQISKTSITTDIKLPNMEIDTTGMTTKEKNFIANREKEKGNEAFAIGDYKEAAAYYNRSLSAFPTVAAYNNKAQAEIKLQNWHVALHDCETVLKMDPQNVKALMRRATVYNNLQNFRAAVEDLKKVLQIEPENATAQKKLLDTEKNLKVSEPLYQKEKKGKRILIQDIEEPGDEGGGGNEGEYEKGGKDKKTAVLAGGENTSQKTEMGNAQKKHPSKGDGCKSEPKEAQKRRDPSESGVKKGKPEKKASPVLKDCETLKAEGNELFKSGQFGEALLKYSEAITNVLSSGIQCPEELSILYSNRAACYLKEGNCVDCIQDCNSALELHPYSLKPLLRRAMAYESMERYRQAYVDYKTLLQIDSGIQAANDSVNRITRTLMDQDGPNWREKLSPIPVVPVSAQLHWWDGENFTSNTKQKETAARQGEQLRKSSENPDEMFTILKNKGNEFVKKGDFAEALKKYNECMKLNPQELTVYTNRALCCLKLFQYEQAKKDCDYVLHRDDSNIKALYRRALAYKGLKNYKASIDDLNKVLQINPSIVEAKTELQEVTTLLKLNNEVGDKKQEKQRKKIEIQEANEHEEKEDTEASASEHASVSHDSAKGEFERTVPLSSTEKLVISKPSNAYEFGQIINVLNANKDITACAELLTMIEPKDLPALLSNKLEGDIFLIFIRALQSDVLYRDPDLVYQHLVHLSKAERFKMVRTLLSRNEVEQVQQLFDSLAKEKNQQFSLGDLESLKRDFEL
ncbi:hypothetical protein JRQ81_010532 [Phrynocephalus forsythii]|uniref:RNA-polymerase II-associated protein 3-like C-terminal domain-containing protein n=1 Tax=Phrynocephalus forsythii TaxID=171643 RepID=A0A9Q0Y037_9SAUR|nr:hypothetical protein JRQ81_010532 [Phrynocephalus forsythii]